MIDHERIKNLTGALQSLAITIAVIVGGIWTLYRFDKLEDVVSLDLNLAATQLPSESAEPVALLVTVTIRNNGTRPIALDLSQHPLVIQRIETRPVLTPDKHSPGRMREVGSEIVAVKSWRPQCQAQYAEGHSRAEMFFAANIAPRTTQVITFLQQLDGPGLYFVAFGSQVSEAILNKTSDVALDRYKAAQPLRNPDVWSTFTYVHVSAQTPSKLVTNETAPVNANRTRSESNDR